MTFVVNALHVALDGQPVLNGINACFAPGQVNIVLGPNGAGKSTLLACLAGLYTPDQGQVLYNGQSILSLPPQIRARAIAFLPQNGDVYWDMDVASVVGLGRMPYRDSRHHTELNNAAADDAAIIAALEATNTTHLAQRCVTHLSGGERSRVLLARALAGTPDWLLADEPLTSLDPRHQLDMLAHFQAIARQGIGVILVVHDLTQAAQHADAVFVMCQGQIRAQGAARAVLTPDVLAAAFNIDVYTATTEAGASIIVPTHRRS